MSQPILKFSGVPDDPNESWPEPSGMIERFEVCPGCWESLMMRNGQVCQAQSKFTADGICFGFHGEA
jgi:hypothetical protein